MAFCINCGGKIIDGSKFCHLCGTAVPSITPQPSEQRKEEFVGTVLKCSHCGSVISESTVVCDCCGYQLTKKEAVSSVQAFKNQLMEIENSRESSRGKVFSIKVDPADMKKLSLIRNFPIPNSIDDIIEFMLLAIANIDVTLSKRNWANKLNNFGKSTEVNATIPTTISNAWVSKMQQAYQKAEILFPNEPVFINVKKIYTNKLEELKIKE